MKILIAFLATALIPCFAQTAEQMLENRAIRALHGNPSIDIRGIVVIGGSPGGTARALTDGRVHDATELTLRKNGIPIIPGCDGGTDNCGRLAVRVSAICTKSDLVDRRDSICTMTVTVQYLEQVMAIRMLDDPEKSFRDFSPVWEYPLSKPLLTTEKDLASKAQSVWSEAVDQFSLYYLRANPK